jgi:hypothetical protein
VVYNGLLKKERQEIHEQIALAWIPMYSYVPNATLA